MSIFDTFQFKLLSPGTYWADKNTPVVFERHDFYVMAKAYNGEDKKPKRPAPIIFGHQEGDAEAWGTVSFLEADKDLVAWVRFSDLRDSMRRAIRGGIVGRHAAQFYAPENPKNPVPNTWFLKHLGFTGPAPDVPTGTLTQDVEFAEYVEVATPAVSLDPWNGGAVFAQYATRPKDPGTIASLASAYQAEYRRRMGGLDISIADCVHRVTKGYQ